MSREARWFEKYRLDWIAEMLTVYGFVNRAHLMRRFGISEPQASKDLREFKRTRDDEMEYDTSAKCYLAKPNSRKKRTR